MRIRWQTFWIGTGIGLGAAAGWVWWQRRQKPAAPLLGIDQLSLSELQGNWYELAVRDPGRGQADWVGTWYQVSSTATGTRLNCNYRLSQFDQPEQLCESAVQRPPQAGPGGLIEIGRRQIWILELTSSYLVAGTADRQAVWVLARQPELPENLWQRIRADLKARGFNPDLWSRTPHHQVGNG